MNANRAPTRSSVKVRALQPFFLAPVIALALDRKARTYALFGAVGVSAVGLTFDVAALIESLRFSLRSNFALTLALISMGLVSTVVSLLALRRERRRDSVR